MMKETNIQSQVTSTIAGDDGEAMAKSEGYVAEKVLQQQIRRTLERRIMRRSRGKRVVREAVVPTTFVFVRVEDKSYRSRRIWWRYARGLMLRPLG